MKKPMRDIQLKFRVSESERKIISDNLEQCNHMNIGKYLRQMAVNGCILVVDYSAIKEMTYEIHKIGVNINQIAHKVNTTESISSNEIQQIKEMLDVIWQYQKSILSEEP